jgi:uncharacterized membrane protein
MYKMVVLFTLIFFISPTVTVVVYGRDYTPSTLVLEVYLDGSVNLEYVVEPDPLMARVNVTLPGDRYEGLIITDSEGTILNWDSTSDGVRVDTLGSSEITITYLTQTLTNKTGSMWAISVNSDVNSIVTLPRGAVLVSLSPAPSGIMVLDNRATITMPPNCFRVSYILGATGVRETALALLTDAESKIHEVKVQGLILIEAEFTLDQSRKAYDLGQYAQSEEFSFQASEMIKNLVKVAEDAAHAINETKSLIFSKEGKVGGDVLGEADVLLEAAEEAYSSGDYREALSKAEKAYRVVIEAAPVQQGVRDLITAGIVISVPAVSATLYLLKNGRSELKPGDIRHAPKVDLDTILENKPYLRKQDKAVLRYLHETGGSFITDIRQHFEMSKSSGWRMISRLKKEELVEASTLGRETYLRLREEDPR